MRSRSDRVSFSDGLYAVSFSLRSLPGRCVSEVLTRYFMTSITL
jgi:hypothetical protein